MHTQDANALVVGGASGLGEATARRLAAGGAQVTIADLNAEKGEALAGELGGGFVACDVTKPDEVEGALAAAERVGISGCCAGLGWAGRTPRQRGPDHLAPLTT